MSPFTSKLGFTLVELLVVIAIMATLAAMIFPKISQYAVSQQLNESVLGFIGIIRAAQANAISGTLCGDQFTPKNKARYWEFNTFPGSDHYSYRPYCIDSNGNFLNLIPENSFSYAGGIKLAAVTVLDSSNAEVCSPTIGTEVVGFSNVSGAVQFLNIDPDGQINQLDPCQDSKTPNLQRLKYTLATTQSSIDVFVDKSGLVYSSQTPLPTQTP